MNFKTIAIITLTATLSISLAGCGDVDAKVAQDASSDLQASVSALPVEVAAASKGDIFATYHTTTAISADAEAPVRAKVEGEIIQLLVEEGDRVVAGQVLARCDYRCCRRNLRWIKSAMNISAL